MILHAIYRNTGGVAANAPRPIFGIDFLCVVIVIVVVSVKLAAPIFHVFRARCVTSTCLIECIRLGVTVGSHEVLVVISFTFDFGFTRDRPVIFWADQVEFLIGLSVIGIGFGVDLDVFITFLIGWIGWRG